MEKHYTINELLDTGCNVMVPSQILEMQAALRESRERIQRILDAEPEEMELLLLDFRQMLEAWGQTDLTN